MFLKWIFTSLIVFFCYFLASAQTSAQRTPSSAMTNLRQLMETQPTCLRVSVSGKSPMSQRTGYLQGMAATLVRSYCRNDHVRSQMINGARSAERDALIHLGVTNGTSPEDILVNTALVTLSLGFRESDGGDPQWLGVDQSNSRSQSHAVSAEAGIFQISYDVRGGESNWRAALDTIQQQYTNRTDLCFATTFAEGLPRREIPSRVVGVANSPAHDFQTLMRNCPAAAAEYAMVVVRHNRRHNGPINRRETKINEVEPCRAFFKEALRRAQTQPNYCRELGMPESPPQGRPHPNGIAI